MLLRPRPRPLGILDCFTNSYNSVDNHPPVRGKRDRGASRGGGERE